MDAIPAGKVLLEITTPKGLPLRTLATEVTLPGADGDLGVLPGHVPLVTSVRPGIVRFRCEGEAEKAVAVAVGVAEITGEKVVLLVRDCVEREGVDPVQVRLRLQEVDGEILKLGGAEADDEETSIARVELIRTENWLAAQLELYGDPPPAQLRRLESFGPPPALPEDEDAGGEGTSEDAPADDPAESAGKR
jgi:F-type H+-transporting ATPase subunit epsilon